MTESEQSETHRVESHEQLAFGDGLLAARKGQGLTVAEVAKSIHLSKEIIDAIECSDIDRLPQPTFVQGYLRAYARHLDLDEKPILEKYSTAVPHELESELHPRSQLPTEANSDSPFVKSISTLLIVLMALAAVYGVFNYYSEMFESTSTKLDYDADEDSILVIPEYEISMEESNNQTLPLTNSAFVLALPEEMQAKEAMPAQSQKEIAVSEHVVEDTQQKTEAIAAKPRLKVQPAAPGNDVVELTASEDSWTEVVDANDVGLLYDLVGQSQTVVLRGTAPFDIFLGNAPATVLMINGVKVNMTKFIRSNKIAQFNVSVNDQQVVFH